MDVMQYTLSILDYTTTVIIFMWIIKEDFMKKVNHITKGRSDMVLLFILPFWVFSFDIY